MLDQRLYRDGHPSRSNSDRFLIWEAPVQRAEGEQWHYILELYARPDDATLAKLRGSQFMYGWLQLHDSNRVLGDVGGLPCWHARHQADMSHLKLYEWVCELLQNAMWR